MVWVGTNTKLNPFHYPRLLQNAQPGLGHLQGCGTEWNRASLNPPNTNHSTIPQKNRGFWGAWTVPQPPSASAFRAGAKTGTFHADLVLLLCQKL